MPHGHVPRACTALSAIPGSKTAPCCLLLRPPAPTCPRTRPAHSTAEPAWVRGPVQPVDRAPSHRSQALCSHKGPSAHQTVLSQRKSLAFHLRTHSLRLVALHKRKGGREKGGGSTFEITAVQLARLSPFMLTNRNTH